MKKASVVYFSPQENTRIVARWFGRFLKYNGIEVSYEDLNGRNREEMEFIDFTIIRRVDLLVLGSPVYANHIPPPVEWFLKQLPRVRGKFAVPYVTYGGVSSGVALSEMVPALQEKGYRVIGAAKILGKHSLMFQGGKPLGREHPDEVDKGMVEKLVKKIQTKMRRSHSEEIPHRLIKNPSTWSRLVSRGVNLATLEKVTPSIKIHPGKCTRCGDCLPQCPVKVIKLTPELGIMPGCILCYNCVRVCPEKAFEAKLQGFERMLRTMAVMNRERPQSRIWF